MNDFETHVQKHLASMQCIINALPRVTTTTDDYLARLEHCTGSNQGISGPTFLSGNFELVPYTFPEFFLCVTL